MNVLIITNIFLQANQWSIYIKKRGIENEAISINKPLNEIDTLIKKHNIIILDLPIDKSKDIVKRIRNIDINKPIIVIGSDVQYKDIIDISKIGIYKYIRKPFDPEILVKYIKEYESKEEILERSAKKGYAIYTRNINDILIVNILGYLQEEIIDELKNLVGKYKKVAISLNGISSMSLNVDVLRKFVEILKIENSEIKFIVIREKIKNILVEEGVEESLLFPNEFLAIKSFSGGKI